MTAVFTVPAPGPASAPGAPPADRRAARFRLVVHGGGTAADVQAFVPAVARLVGEEARVYGEFPTYEPGDYTFILDLVPWSRSDAMEHRNSTFISAPGATLATAEGRATVLEMIAHEFFHGWNMERIRAEGLEPFDFTRENVTCCLWLGEGFTQYYGPLLLVRAGLASALPLGDVNAVTNGSGRLVRSAVQMSQYAPFADAAVSNDPTDQDRSFISYYTYGSALALALDLSVREHSQGRRSLDDYMRTLWIRFGRPADPRPGYVAHPYSLADLQQALADTVGDPAFAASFFRRFVTGHEVPDYAHLLGLAGYAVVRVAPGRAWIGEMPVEDTPAGLLIGTNGPDGSTVTPYGTPLYDAGIDEGDVLLTIDDQPGSRRTWTALADRRPGERVRFTVRRRDGQVVTTSAVLGADPRVTVVPVESTGATLTPAERQFRAAWLGDGPVFHR